MGSHTIIMSHCSSIVAKDRGMLGPVERRRGGRKGAKGFDWLLRRKKCFDWLLRMNWVF